MPNSVWVKESKYHNKKTTVYGIDFDSKKEAERYRELKMLERSGIIDNLQMQVKYVLIPSQREETEDGKKGKLLEKECAYYADFVYYDKEKKKTVVEDVKGKRTSVYIIKRKLMMFKYGIRIKEI